MQRELEEKRRSFLRLAGWMALGLVGAGAGFAFGAYRKRMEDSSPEALVSFISSRRLPVRYEDIIRPQARVLMFGEAHSQDKTRLELTENTRLIKDMGFTHIAFEVLQADLQPIVQEYQGSTMTIADFAKSVREINPLIGPYLGLIEKSKLAGLQIIPLGMYKADLKKLTVREENGRLIVDDGTNLPEREQWMFDTLKDTLDSDSFNKVAVLIGSAHLKKDNFRVAGRLVQSGFDISTVSLIGGGIQWVRVGDEEEDIVRLISEAGISNERFMLSGKSLLPRIQLDCDFVINRP